MNDNEELARLLQKFSNRNVKDRRAQLAQNEFYNRLKKEINGHVRILVNHNDDVAEVALQNAWVKVFVSAHTYDPKLASVKTWVKMISSQCAKDELRQLYRRQKHIVDIDKLTHDDGEDAPSGLDSFICPLPSSEERLYGKQVQQAVAQCIERLPGGDGPNYRLAMKLTLDEDLTYAEMKDILSWQSMQHANLNAEQVRGWVRQAVLKMKGCINEKLGLSGKGSAK